MKITPIDIPRPIPVKTVVYEKDIENYLKRQVRRFGGLTRKFASPNNRAVPDQICIFPQSGVWFVECKRPGYSPTVTQERELELIKIYGGRALWVDSKESVDFFIQCATETQE